MMDGHITCVVCPLGCKIAVRKDGVEYLVEGNRCPKGKEYAVGELVSPKRVLTTSVKVLNGLLPLVSVKTPTPIDRALIIKKMAEIKQLELQAPVDIGEVVLENLDGSGTPLLATRRVERSR